MSADRYEISECELDVLAITGPEGTRYIDGEDIEAKIIRQQARDIAALKDALADEVTANEAFRKAGGARDDEDMPTFCARLVAERDEAVAHWNMSAKCVSNAIDEMSAACVERDQLRTDLAAAVAERDKLRAIAELEVFAEIGRQWNTDSSLAKWFPLTAERVEQDAQEIAKLRADLAAAVEEREKIRTMYIEAIERFCDDLQALRERAEQAEARLAAIESAPTVAVVSECAAGLYVHQKLFGAQLAEPGAELIYRPAKDQT